MQAIKRPTLLEFYGPLMMSYAVASNLQYRLSEDQGGTLITLHHYAVGAIPAEYRKAMEGGWHTIHERAKQRAERQSRKRGVSCKDNPCGPRKLDPSENPMKFCGSRRMIELGSESSKMSSSVVKEAGRSLQQLLTAQLPDGTLGREAARRGEHE